MKKFINDLIKEKKLLWNWKGEFCHFLARIAFMFVAESIFAIIFTLLNLTRKSTIQNIIDDFLKLIGNILSDNTSTNSLYFLLAIVITSFLSLLVNKKYPKCIMLKRLSKYGSDSIYYTGSIIITVFIWCAITGNQATYNIKMAISYLLIVFSSGYFLYKAVNNQFGLGRALLYWTVMAIIWSIGNILLGLVQLVQK